MLDSFYGLVQEINHQIVIMEKSHIYCFLIFKTNKLN